MNFIDTNDLPYSIKEAIKRQVATYNDSVALHLEQAGRFDIHLSVTSLNKSPRQLQLFRSHNKEIVVDPEVTHRKHDSRNDTEDKIQRGPARDMAVFFPDGTIIAEKTAVDTLVAVVKKIGVAEVRQVVEEYNLKFCKVPVISNRRDAKYGKSQNILFANTLQP